MYKDSTPRAADPPPYVRARKNTTKREGGRNHETLLKRATGVETQLAKMSIDHKFVKLTAS